MAEILGWIVVFLLLSGMVSVGVLEVQKMRRIHDPIALRTDEEAKKALYRIARRAVRELEALIDRDGLVPFLSEAQRQEMMTVIKDFDDMNER
jgi:hypothetical protein